MSNTKQRIISAFIMAMLVIVCVAAGKIPTLIMILLVGALCVDELLINFALFNRKSSNYKLILFFYVLVFLAVNVFFQAKLSRVFFTMVALFLNIFLTYYLFKIPLKNNFMKKGINKYPGILSLIAILPLLSFGIFFETDQWREVLGLL